MNDELQKALLAIIDKTSSGIETGITFLSAQLPDIIHQLLLWKMSYSLIQFVCAIVLCIVFVVLDYKFYKKAMATNDPDIIIGGWGMFGTLVRFAAWFIVISLFNLTWLQIWLAPKLYLIEYAATLVKGH